MATTPGTPPHHPAYLELPAGELRRRAERAVAELAECRLCPRDCGTDRLADDLGVCRTGRHAVVANAHPHHGEEDCLRGNRGSGTLFFGHCNLRCVFCQNIEISQKLGKRGGEPAPPASKPREIAGLMLHLQHAGCHNINLVTPEHVVPQVLEAVAEAAESGLHLPLVYNTSGYDDLRALRLLDGVVDVYMPDLKLWSEESARRYLLAADYPRVARAALREMHRQVGDLEIGPDGLARRGLLVRHLVLPGLVEETKALLTWIAEELGPGTYVNLMGQYFPAGRVGAERYPEIARRPTRAELAEAHRTARDLGLRLDERRPRLFG